MPSVCPAPCKILLAREPKDYLTVVQNADFQQVTGNFDPFLPRFWRVGLIYVKN